MKPKNHSHWLEKPNFHNRSVSDLRAKNSTSPQPPPKEGEQAVRKMNVRKQLPLFWRGLGGGVSGLLRSARNDGTALIYNLANLENLNKIVVQDKNNHKNHKNQSSDK